MKKLYLLFAFLVLGLSATAANHFETRYQGEAFIFVERGVEFAIFPDGQFDFFFNPRGNFNRIPTHINYSFNSGYNYGPFIQYDDYGAVIQIENVPVYYDYYGRVAQAGRVRIGYNSFGMVNRIGNMFLHYDFYNQITHTSGFINSRNAAYVYRPWHDYYVRPYSYAVVHHQPYRLYYVPNRMKYNQYKNYYNNHYSNDFQQGYYNPGDQITSYQRGRRTDAPREIETDAPAGTTAAPQRNVRTHTDVRETPAQRAQAPVRTSRMEAPAVKQNVTTQSRTSRVEAPTVEKNVQIQSRAARVEAPAVQRRVETRSSSPRVEAPAVHNNVQQNRSSVPAREVQATSRRIETPAAVKSTPLERTPEAAPTRGTRSSRGQ